MGRNYQENPEPSIYAATYQSLNGNNYTLAGVDVKFANGKPGNASFFLGAGTDIQNKQYEAVLDLKGKLNYNDIFNANARLRTKVGVTDGELSKACQVRVAPLSVDVPVSENTSIYATPYYKMQSDGENIKHSLGAFTGLNHKFSNHVSGFAEIECNNLQKFNNFSKNSSLNIGCRVKF